MAQPHILLLDIETLPNVVTSWGLKINSGYLDHKNIIKERTILCAAWKWLGSPKVRTVAVKVKNAKPSEDEDRRILKRLWKELMMADAVVAHNGDRFDLPWLRTRMLMLGLPPCRPVIQIDTKKLAKQHFYFNSNRLDYLGRALKVGSKIKTDYDLWLECMASADPVTRRLALAKMITYNKEDVRLLERIFLKLRPWVPAKLNLALLADNPGRVCPSCGEEDALVAKGLGYTRTGTRRTMKCRACGAWSYVLSNNVPR